MLGYPKLRRAQIPAEHRTVFERIGETGIQLTLSGGFNPKSPELSGIYRNDEVSKYAQEWLTERADIHTRHEWRMERVEWAVLIFVVLGVVADFVLAFHGSFSK